MFCGLFLRTQGFVELYQTGRVLSLVLFLSITLAGAAALNPEQESPIVRRRLRRLGAAMGASREGISGYEMFQNYKRSCDDSWFRAVT